MSDLENVYGVHAVEALLRHHPKRVKQLILADGRSDDQRIQVLRQLADEARVQSNTITRKEMDEQIDGVHQGVVAKV
ncbi:MAG: 23S rRNA (guanosine(2251)-2'-O)-methyltransferase RlmB, partial [Gammaproteobacteria bacterium]|nr:23S rRNA (guanosine(2251)-2'-O)-methyltransferase RlmB [Gammaproteobacteria bacterium]